MWSLTVAVALILATQSSAGQHGANRLVYLDNSCDPYYVSLSFPKLTTPQWVGEEGVEAVVTLGIDDMRDTARYESYLRPILNRLKQIDGRAPVSIMTNSVDITAPQLDQWLEEGLSIETHTADHPCPCLQGGNLATAKSTYDRCVDQIASIAGNNPVAFRFPCMDSLNTPSPRAFAEIINKTTPQGNFLQISSSVTSLLTRDDPKLPVSLTMDADGRGRFAKYIPFTSYVNKTQNYPYPFVVGRLCWEFPYIAPDDWQGQNLHRPFNPQTVADIKAAIDAVVLKQGIANITFHPWAWIRQDQMISIIDHTVEQHGKQVKFLNFRECLQRINEHLLAGQPLRASNGQDNGVRLLDLNADGFLDVCIGNENMKKTRVWLPQQRRWQESAFPTQLVHVDENGNRTDAGVRFGILRNDGKVSMLVRNEQIDASYFFDRTKWVKDNCLLRGLEFDGERMLTATRGRDMGVRLRDVDADGRCELLIGNPRHNRVWKWQVQDDSWQRCKFSLPESTMIVDGQGRDAGLRFVDVNEDGHDDVLFGNEAHTSLSLFDSLEQGWLRVDRKPDAPSIPVISRGGINNGAWFADRHMWLQNEHTSRLPDGVDRRSFVDLLGEDHPRPKTPAASLKSLRVANGFRVELLAAEPLVMDPISLDWGPDGKLWVVEMGDYPLGSNDDGHSAGRVRYLEDTNGDGQYDKSTVFLDGLNYPTGVMSWRDGILVSAAPEIFYATDTDSDGQADHREVLYRGFAKGNQQHRVNGFAWGLDNWVYVANGDSGGTIESLKTGETVDINGRDLRIQPDSGAITLQTGLTQFGRRRDDWGNWFSCTNNVALRHIVLADHYLRRNPYVTPPAPTNNIARTDNTQVFPIGQVLSHWEGYQPPKPGDRHIYTAACGISVYRDKLFGKGFANNVFLCEPIFNLVHRRILSPDGLTFTSHRAPHEQTRDFLASYDSWFRPTTARTGPDGALWITDMYRLVIEHPEYINDEDEMHLDLRAGDDRGRIYRISPAAKTLAPIPKLANLDTVDLVGVLNSSNGWQRDTAQRLLIQRRDHSATIPLIELLTSSRSLTRLHALCTLDGMESLTADHISRALSDPLPGVRRHAVRLAESRLTQYPHLVDTLVRMVDDNDLHVLLQLSYTLGKSKDQRTAIALGNIARAHHDSRYLMAGVLSSLGVHNVAAALDRVIQNPNGSESLTNVRNQILETAAALGETKVLTHTLSRSLNDERNSTSTLRETTGLLQIAARRELDLEETLDADSIDKLRRLAAHTEQLALNDTTSAELRLASIELLGLLPGNSIGKRQDTLVQLLNPRHAPTLQAAAVDALGDGRDRNVAVRLLEQWSRLSPSLREAVVGKLLTRQPWAEILLDQLSTSKLNIGELCASHRQRLLTHESQSLRTRANKLFAGVVNPDRDAIVATYRPILHQAGDRERGRQLFVKHCAGCHRAEGFGHVVGPDLTALTNQVPEAILTAVLDPNRSIESKYRSYTVRINDGRTLTGILTTETTTSITILAKEAKQEVVLRRDIEELISSAVSLMPEGLDKELPPPAMADLLAYVTNLGPPPKQFPGNEPREIVSNNDGVLELSAVTSRVYGSTIEFESTHKNLGFWQSEDDRALWSLRVSKSGEYDVSIDYACDNSTANNSFVLHIGGQQITGRIAGTGTWDDYRDTKIGRVYLERGTYQASFRSLGAPSNCLIDLRTIVIRPLNE